MIIFKLVPDLKTYKFFVFASDEQAARALQLEGQRWQGTWQPLQLKMFLEFHKKDTRRENFAVSCYDEGVIIAEQQLALNLAPYTDSLELLPVETDRTEAFVLLNPVRVVDALSEVALQGIGVLLDLEAQGNLVFKNVTATDHIFRDATLPHLIYFSEEFANTFKKKFVGAHFAVAGATG